MAYTIRSYATGSDRQDSTSTRRCATQTDPYNRGCSVFNEQAIKAGVGKLDRVFHKR